MLIEPPKIAVIIVSYNGEKWIYECIRSIVDNGYYNYEIVVVDNASKDATVSIIREYYSNVILLNQKRNLGFGRGANIGIQYAASRKNEYILILNQDIRLGRDCIENMTSVMEQNKDIGIASPLQMNYDGTGIDPHFRRLYHLKSERPEENEKLFQESIEVDNIIGASMMFRIAVIDALGTFDPIFFLYHEEGDLCRRARYHGFKIRIIPDAVVYHEHIQLSPKAMTLKAKFSSTYGYYIYILKDPFLPFRQNLYIMLKQMKEWMFRDPQLIKITERGLINVAAAIVVLIRLHRIVKNRTTDMIIKNNSYVK